jgi:capsule polysaccharide export protein KpsE/RkpR
MQFFLEGTQLHTLMNSYTQVNEMLDQISAIIDQQRGQVPELENRVESLRRQIDASRKIVELKKKSRDIHRELAWSYVVRKEQVRKQALSRLTRTGPRL